MNVSNPRVDGFSARAGQWRAEFSELRRIALASGLNEELKWGVPCYTCGKSNVALIHGFKDYCAMLFVKGALLRDPRGVLITQTANVQAARQVRFTNVAEIRALEPVLWDYLVEAIALEKAGLCPWIIKRRPSSPWRLNFRPAWTSCPRCKAPSPPSRPAASAPTCSIFPRPNNPAPARRASRSASRKFWPARA